MHEARSILWTLLSTMLREGDQFCGLVVDAGTSEGIKIGRRFSCLSRSPELSQSLQDEINSLRKEKDSFLAADPDSPIPMKERSRFKGLKYFAPDPTYPVHARLGRFEKPERVIMATCRGTRQSYLKYAGFRFDDKERSYNCSLTSLLRTLTTGPFSFPSRTSPPALRPMALRDTLIWKSIPETSRS